MARNYPKIDPEDMSKLRVIVQLMSRGSTVHARQLARAIKKTPAKEIAALLTKEQQPGAVNQPMRNFAETLRRGRMPERQDLVAVGH